MSPSSSSAADALLRAAAPLPRPTVQAMAAYQPPLEGRREKIRLDFNENTEGFAPLLPPALQGLDVITYPEYEAFHTQLCETLGIPTECCLLLNGSDEGLAVIPQTYLQAGQDAALYTRPSFAMIRHNLMLADARCLEVLLNDDLTYPLEAIEAQLREQQPKLAIFANPDNPTGAILPKAQVLQWCEQFPNTLFVLDEAYTHYAGPDFSALQDAVRLPNLLVLQTFSKAWGLAGLRLGFVVGHPQHIRWMGCVRSPYSINVAAISAAAALVAQPQVVAAQAEALMVRKASLLDTLTQRGFETHAGPSNFFLLKLGLNATPFTHFCEAHGLLIRNQTANPKLQGWVRVSVGNEAENDTFLQLLEHFCQRTALMFDLDDTLIDTTQSFDAVIAFLIRKHSDVPLGKHELQRLREEGGYNDDWDAAKELLRRRGLVFDYAFLAAEGDKIYQTLAKEVETWRLPVGHLQALAKRYRLFIYTGRARHEFEPIWGAELAPLFEAIYCSDDVAGLAKKPAPDYLRYIQERYNLGRSWYIGNSVDDMRAATAAGCHSLAVSTTFPPERLLEAGAEHLFASPEALLEAFACEHLLD